MRAELVRKLRPQTPRERHLSQKQRARNYYGRRCRCRRPPPRCCAGHNVSAHRTFHRRQRQQVSLHHSHRPRQRTLAVVALALDTSMTITSTPESSTNSTITRINSINSSSSLLCGRSGGIGGTVGDGSLGRPSDEGRAVFPQSAGLPPGVLAYGGVGVGAVVGVCLTTLRRVYSSSYCCCCCCCASVEKDDEEGRRRRRHPAEILFEVSCQGREEGVLVTYNNLFNSSLRLPYFAAEGALYCTL